MKLVCLFKQCDWQFITNVAERIAEEREGEYIQLKYWKTGLYQCRRCKAISRGAPDGRMTKG